MSGCAADSDVDAPSAISKGAGRMGNDVGADRDAAEPAAVAAVVVVVVDEELELVASQAVEASGM